MVLLKLATLSTVLSFLWSGLLINVLQLLNYVLLRRANFKIFSQINWYLLYSLWSQVVALFDWFYDAKFTIYHSNEDQIENFFKEHSICLGNHGYELDWSGAWLMTDKIGHLASCKAMLKNDLKYLPVIGWAWFMSDQLFLDRNWEKDRHKLNSGVDNLLRYEPMIATFFCEGTRFTTDKFEEAQKFAAERGLQVPRHHLIPRTKGFVAVCKHLKQRKRENPDLKINIYNVEIAFDDSGAMNLTDIVKRGLSPKGHIYFERIAFDEVPDEDEACAKWLQDLYLKKDDLQDYFLANRSFPGVIDKRYSPYKPRLSTITYWILAQCYTILPLAYLLIRLQAACGTFYVSITIAIFFTASYLYLNYVIYQADVSDELRKRK